MSRSLTPYPPPSNRPRAWCTRIGMAGLLLIGLLAGHDATSTAAELESGLPMGKPIPEFFSRVVTGPLMNKSVCYVCRNGSRPVVMVFVRETSPAIQRLLRNVDIIVDRHRADGLRSFGVLLSERPSQSDVSRVQTFAFDGRVRMPLVIAPSDVGSTNQQNVHPDAAVTIVCYRNRRSRERMSLRADELDASHLQRVLKRVLRFATSDDEPANAM